MGNRGPLPRSVPFEQLVGQVTIEEAIKAAQHDALAELSALSQETDPTDYICEDCGRHLPCRHCKEEAA